jgi:hypothetical protein
LKSYNDLNIVPNLIKIFLRSLPEPLLTYNLYDDFKSLSSIVDENELIDKINVIIPKLPKLNKIIFKKLLELLHEITTRSDVNKMSPSNLSIIFAVNLLKGKFISQSKLLEDGSKVNKSFDLLITHFKKFDSAFDKEYNESLDFNDSFDNENDLDIEKKSESLPPWKSIVIIRKAPEILFSKN